MIHYINRSGKEASRKLKACTRDDSFTCIEIVLNLIDSLFCEKERKGKNPQENVVSGIWNYYCSSKQLSILFLKQL